MIRQRASWVFALSCTVCALVLSGGQVPNSRSEPVKDTSYGDLTDKEHCLQNLVISFERRDINGYDAILHPDFEFVLVRGDRYDREHELMGTKATFNAVSGITMDIGDGEWARIEETNGAKCAGCWETIRILDYTVVTKDKEREPETYHCKIRLVAAPIDDAGVTRYKLRVWQDLQFEPSEP
jgi:hypothetical protein